MDLGEVLKDLFLNYLLLPTEFVQLFVAAFVGFIIGLERERKGKPASIRTFALICIGSCLFTILSSETVGNLKHVNYDITRIAAQIVSGVGFLGAGVIFKTHDRIEGVTTAALIWVSAALGMACGYNQLNLVLWAIIVWVLVYLISYFVYNAISFLRLCRHRSRQKKKILDARCEECPMQDQAS